MSAVAKLLSADTFELYLFSLEIFPMGLSFVLARVVIAFELFLGVWMVSNLHARLSAAVGIFTLAGFSLFLVWLMLRGDEGSCHCFGELVDFTPVQSLTKNLAMTALLLPGLWGKSFNVRHKWFFTALVFIASFATVFIVSVPDNFRFSEYASHHFDDEDFREAVEEEAVPASVMEGSKLVCFFSTTCHYCNMTARKLGILRRTTALEPCEGVDFSDAELVCIFPERKEDYPVADSLDVPSPASFLEDTRLEGASVTLLSPEKIISITHGSLPMVLFMNDGRVLKEFGYRDLH